MSAPPALRTAEQIASSATGPRAVPALGTEPRRRPPAVSTQVLDNGLQVVAARRPGAPLVEVRLRIPFAGRTRSHAARAELLASTLLLGSTSRTREQVDTELARFGGHLDAGVDPQRLSISGSVLSTGLVTLLEVLGDLLTEPGYRRHDVLGERDRLAEHLALAASQPSVIARANLQRRRFGDHPATWELPTPDEVGDLTRAALTALHQRSVVPAGSTLVLVGDLSPAATLRAVDRHLGAWRSDRTATSLGTPPAVLGGPLEGVHRVGAVQSQVRLTGPAPVRTDPGYPAAQLANLVYGGYFSSRLVENIREDKGFTYSAHSGMEFWPGRAALTITFDTATPATAAAFWEARYELGRMTVSPPTPEELEAARNYAIGSLATSLSTQAGLASTLSSLLGWGVGLDWLRGHPARLAAVTATDIAAAASTLFAPPAMTGVVVGDLDVIGPRFATLGDLRLP